ncbi:MAG: ribosome small subunit-dependent GTPase A [Thermoflexaceae bacterium]|nr:ribosome small subunit-dependent GTPase A [Thermoflexaceae bacterium]
MTGKIVKGIAGFYYVYCDGKGLFECKAKGVFRNKKIKPLVGDNVELDILDEDKFLGSIVNILPRNNCLLRPEVANVDQAVIIFAVREPEPNLNLLSRFLIRMEKEGVDTIICFNKEELADESRCLELRGIFEESGCRVLFTSTYEKTGMEELLCSIEGKTTVFAGPSGVGKSSVINYIYPDAFMETGAVSDKIKRGKHTTRHSELFHVHGDTYIMDTPGFTSLYLEEFDKDEIRFYFHEFEPYEGKCRFHGCVHVNEPDCAVKEAVAEGKINRIRYENYVEIYNERKNVRRY